MSAAPSIAKFARLNQDVAVARRALGLDAAERHVTAALGSPGSARRTVLVKGLWLLSRPAVAKALGKGLWLLSGPEVKALRLRAEAQAAAPDARPMVIVPPPERPTAAEPATGGSSPTMQRPASGVERLAAWSQVIGFPLGLLSGAAGVLGALRMFGVI